MSETEQPTHATRRLDDAVARRARARIGRGADGPRRRRRARTDAPFGRARPGRGRPGPVPGHEARHRAGHRRRLLLRLPAAAAADPRRPAGDRGADAREHRGRPPVRAQRDDAGRSPRVPRRARPAVQGRDRRRPPRRRGARRRGRCRRRPSTGRVRSSTCAAARTSRAPARSARSSSSARPAPTGAATRSARCSSASTARPGRRRRSSTQYLWRREEAKKRDHRTPRRRSSTCSASTTSRRARRSGTRRARRIWRTLEGAMRELQERRGYQEVSTPILVSERLWRQSGHWDLYKENMFIVESENQLFSLKPMNCPESTFIYESQLRSYRDLPLRFNEYGRLHRNERSGTLSGLTRVRQFIQDDAHIYVRPDQLADEIEALLGEVREAYGWVGTRRRASPSRRSPTRPSATRRSGSEPRASSRTPSSVRACRTSPSRRTGRSTRPRSTSTSTTPSGASGRWRPSRPT